MNPRVALRSPFWRARGRELATIVPVAAAFAALRRLDLVADTPIWAYVVAMAGAYAISLATSAVFSDDDDPRSLWIRTFVTVAVSTVAIYMTGLGPMLAIGYLVIAADEMRSAGSRAAKPVFVWSLLALACGQAAIALDLAPTLLREGQSHGLAVLAALAMAPAFLLFMSVAGARERSEETASRLLDLATVLASGTTRQDVCRRLADGVPRVAGLARSTVMLWDGSTLRAMAAHGYEGDDATLVAGLRVTPSDSPLLTSMLRDPRVMPLSPATDDAYVRSAFARFGGTEGFVAPMVIGGQVAGVIFVDRVGGRPSGLTPTLHNRLRGLADQGAIALENARLLEQERDVVEQLRETDRAKSEFLAVVSHELRTPLSVMMGAARTLHWRGNELDGEMREALVDSIVRRGEQLNRLVEDLLQASGEVKLELAPVDLASLVRTAVADAEELHGGRAVVARVPDEPVTVRADTFRLRQVVDNLITNATKYAPDGKIEVEAGWVGDDGWICVTDDGPGMSEDDAVHAFDPFYQADSSAVRKVGGLGLGLHICRRIVEAHGGRIWIESHPGRGTRVKFTLPANGPA